MASPEARVTTWKPANQDTLSKTRPVEGQLGGRKAMSMVASESLATRRDGIAVSVIDRSDYMSKTIYASIAKGCFSS